MTETGLLILGATPIGHLGDVSHRLLDTMGSVDEIWCEDTRVTRKLLSHFQISKPLHAFHEYSQSGIRKRIQDRLEGGASLLYVSDAGMPGISDPGFELVKLAREVGAEVDVLPGPSSVLNALVLSGFSCHQFAFMGFFPEKQTAQKALLDRLALLNMTTIHFESPRRITRTLSFLNQQSPETRVALCRELTKQYQEVLIDTPANVLENLKMLKGEMVLVIEAISKTAPTTTPLAHYNQLLAEGLPPRDALKQTSKLFSIKKRDLYAMILKGENEAD